MRPFNPEEEEDSDAAPDLVGVEPPVPPHPVVVARPSRPDEKTISLHEVTHLPPADWCLACQACKARGQYHKRVPVDEMRVPVVEFDYTFFSLDANQKLVNNKVVLDRDIATVLVAYDKRTGYSMATMVEKKGINKFALASIDKFLRELNYEQVILRGDGEPSLQALL